MIDRNCQRTHEFQGVKASFLILLEVFLTQDEKLSIIGLLTKVENSSFTGVKYCLIQLFSFTVFHVKLEASHEERTILMFKVFLSVIKEIEQSIKEYAFHFWARRLFQ